jgi:hypothetical protein
MIGRQGSAAVETRILMGRGMRVLLFHEDPEICATLGAAIDQDRGFVLAGQCREWPACERLLDRFLPELLIAGMRRVPPQFLEDSSASQFPVVVGLGAEDDRLEIRDGLYDTLLVPLEAEHICSLLARVRFEIYRRKAAELSALLGRYMECTTTDRRYLSMLKVEDEDQIQEIEIEHVLLVAADGNYIRVHTISKAYEIRETMAGISARLDPSKFVRAHRSFIVNLAHVHGLVTKEGSTAFVRLSNGMEVPVGPNYREKFDSTVHLRNRLTA